MAQNALSGENYASLVLALIGYRGDWGRRKFNLLNIDTNSRLESTYFEDKRLIFSPYTLSW